MKMVSQRRIRAVAAVCALAAFVSIMPTAPAAAAQDGAKRTTCALLPDKALAPADLPILHLLEARLGQRDDIQLVDRTEIERVLQEQKLEAMFDPSGGPQRRMLGNILKADLLVSLRGGESKGPRYLTITACETTRGLRLLNRTLLRSEKPEEDAAAIEGFVIQALRKHSEEIIEVCAVPPFLSRDLTHRYDHLQTAYARLIEQLLLNQTGIVVVELAEAEAVARELLLSGQGEGPVRKLPLYVVGEYRHTGRGDEMKVAVTLSLKRGERVVGTATKPDLAPDEVSGFLQQSAQELLGKATGQRLHPTDRALEAKLLAERAHLFRRIGNWKEALCLFEASLLLEPEEPQVHLQAAIVISELIIGEHLPEADKVHDPVVRLSLCQSGLSHVECFLRASSFDFPVSLLNSLSRCLGAFGQAGTEKGEMLLRLMEAKARAGQLDDKAASFFASYLPYHTPFDKATRLWAIRLIQDLPKARNLTADFAGSGTGLGWREKKTDPAYQAFLDEIEKIPNENIRAGVRDLRERIEEDYARYTKKKPPPQPPQPGEVEGVEPGIVLHGLGLNANPRGWRACGKGTDVVWGPKTIYLMKEKGHLRPIYTTRDVKFNVLDVLYDGKYAWATIYGPQPLVLVIDPEAEKVWEFTEADGLPPSSTFPAATLVEAGRIFVAGSFGRSWCAFLSMNPDGKKSVEIFHEARFHRDPLEEIGDEEINPDVAFTPWFLVTLYDPKTPSDKRILLGRCVELTKGVHPFLIDPAKKTAEVLKEAFVGFLGVGSHEGTAYWTNTAWLAPKDHTGVRVSLWQAGFPDFKVKPVFTDRVLKPEYRFVYALFYGGKVHLVGWNWWTADDATGEFRRVRVSVEGRTVPSGASQDIPGIPYPHLRGFSESRHYGLLFRTGGAIYQVEFR